MSGAQSPTAVLDMFALLFSHRWIARWQQQQRPAEPPPPPGLKRKAVSGRLIYVRLITPGC
mgnify:CR=1 FL=1